MTEIAGNPSEKDVAPRPEFNGGAFTISHFSPSAEGFEFATREIIGKTGPDGLTRERALSQNEKDRLNGAMKGEMEFAKVERANIARDNWKQAGWTGAPSEDVAALKAEYEKERARIKKSGKKIGLRNIDIEGNTLSAQVKTVLYPVYNQFARPDEREALLDLSAATGTAMILRSTEEDGNHRLVIQHRAVAKQRLTAPGLSVGNASYNDMPGASVAGMMDASLDSVDRKPGTPDPVTTDAIKENILKEASEELGLVPDDMVALRIVGLAQDKVKIHDEVLLLADTNLDVAGIRTKSRESKRNRKLGDADFEEKFIDIPATPQAVETLLTQVKCPLPPTHYAAMVAAGYSLVLQERGTEAAEQWKKDLEPKMRANIDAMNQMVTKYYLDHPEVLAQVPERMWGKRHIPGRNQHGYTPAYTPEEQGLSSFEDAMVDHGLMPETRRIVDEADLFDVDGVITDPTTKEVIHPEILDQIADRLKSGIPVALNTGRSIDWLREPVLSPLMKRFEDDKSGLENLAVIGEFGGTWATFNDEGKIQEGQVASLTVSKDLHDKIKNLVENEYGDFMGDDETKRTMLSIEMHTGGNMDEFHAAQGQLVEQLNALISKEGIDQKYIVHKDTIATNIMSPYVGKDLGADRFIEFLRDRGIKVKKFKAYGDSNTDIKMADEAERRGFDSEFVFVGDPQKLNGINRRYPITRVPGYSSGTKDYLNQN